MHKMKTILIATDFSEHANHAAEYALKFANQLGSDIQLIHASVIETDSPLEVLWPKEEYHVLKLRNDSLLEILSTKLSSSLGEFLDSNGEMPKIKIFSAIGPINELLREVVHRENIGLVVLGLSGGGDMTRLIHGSCSRDSIDFAEYPLLLIPKSVQYAVVKKIAFATDLTLGDMEVIQLLSLLAAKLNAALLIVHVIVNRDDTLLTQRIDNFMKELKSKVSYDKMYYENVYQSSVVGGLNWLGNNGGTDLLVVVHRKQKFASGILQGSYAQKMARCTNLPLIVIPEGFNGMLF
jgi:nucleotide-binding universal stress UspA family protein